MSSVILGGFTFKDWEIPDRINFGGRQAVAAHKLIGGTRKIDTTGADDDDISWSGRFRGSGAIGRASTLDAMRQSGAAVSLMFMGLSRTVVITHFRAMPEKSFEIPYTITVMVSDSGSGTSSIVSTLSSVVSSDVSSLSKIAGTS